MRCIVTAGPTYEPLDEVRRLTNFSTGALGTGLANFLTERNHEVTLLRGQSATSPITSYANRFIPFTTTEDLLRRFEKLATTERVAIFHAAAVSDFTFGKILERQPDGTLKEIHVAKASTRGGTLLAELEPTPKVLAKLRDWFPSALIVGWKYELDADQKEAVSRGQRQLNECRSDACVVNGRAYGDGFGIVTPDGNLRHFDNQPLLFEALGKFIAPPS